MGIHFETLGTGDRALLKEWLGMGAEELDNLLAKHLSAKDNLIPSEIKAFWQQALWVCW